MNRRILSKACRGRRTTMVYSLENWDPRTHDARKGELGIQVGRKTAVKISWGVYGAWMKDQLKRVAPLQWIHLRNYHWHQR